MNCDHQLTPDPRSGIQFCAKCGMDERKVKAEVQTAAIDDIVADAMIDANLNPKFCIEHASALQAFGRAVWARSRGAPGSPGAQAVAWRYPIGGGRFAATVSDDEARRASTDGSVDALGVISAHGVTGCGEGKANGA